MQTPGGVYGKVLPGGCLREQQEDTGMPECVYYTVWCVCALPALIYAPSVRYVDIAD